MPLRLPLLQLRTAHQCLLRTRNALFHTSSTLRVDDPNFYEVLEVAPSANQSQIKKQFYTLSKAHHPDLHPKESTSAQRFVEISTAYATLGNPTKRAAYDRTHSPASHSSGSSRTPSGSHSSAQNTPWGGRPASGLSKRRGSFRGPPPSFYRSGGWGAQGEKRRAAQEGGSEAGAGAGTRAGKMGGGFGLGQGEQRGFDDDVPHFDRAEHLRRQEELDERARERMRRTRQRYKQEVEAEEAGGDAVLKAVVVLGAVVIGAVLAPFVANQANRSRDRREE
ncbi:MAG: hypothetical protein MMC23_004207 [Stictis urceolatum]|nr:hypothetical protein [Stictis urceolata]